jgi:phosphotransferase system HPr (HPr) family protein
VSGSDVYEAEFTVQSELGLHARPAGQFVVLASRFASEISVGRGADWVDGRSVLSLLSLAAGRGTKLRVRAVGPDAQAAVEALGRVLEEQQTAPPRPAAG